MKQGRKKQLQRVSAQVEKFIALYEKNFLGSRNDALVDAGAQKRPRRDGSAPTNDEAHRFWQDPDNRDASIKLERVLPDMRSENRELAGISLYKCLCTAGLGGAWGVDFAEFRRWERKESEDARKHLIAYNAAINILTLMMVAECERRGESPEIKVNPKGDDGQSDEQADSPKDSYDKERRHDRNDSYRTIHGWWLEKVNFGTPREQAKEELAKERNIRQTKIREAIAFVNSENSESVA